MEFLQAFIFPYINFLIFCAILFYAGKTAVREIFSTRKKDYDLALEAGQASLNTAKQDQASIIERMNGLEKEIKQLKDSSFAVTNSEIQRVKEDTARSIEHFRSDAARIASMELQAAQNSLRKTVINKAVKGVEASLIQSIRGRESSNQKSLLAKAFDEFEAASFASKDSRWSVPKSKSANSAPQNSTPAS